MAAPDSQEQRGTTPAHILRTAERLFARKGLDEVSIRDITAAADISISSVYYHFGSKERLILAILERRIAELNDRRAALLAEIEDRTEPTVRDVISLLVIPTAEMAADRRGGGADYVRFLGAVTSHRKYAPLIRQVSPFADEERQMLRRVAPNLSDDEREFRFALIKTIVNQVLGESGTGLRIWMQGSGLDDRTLADQLIDFFTAAFTGSG
ncbi:TetR/AcrR family transcriptional regulator [Actinomadura viridis]